MTRQRPMWSYPSHWGARQREARERRLRGFTGPRSVGRRSRYGWWRSDWLFWVAIAVGLGAIIW